MASQEEVFTCTGFALGTQRGLNCQLLLPGGNSQERIEGIPSEQAGQKRNRPKDSQGSADKAVGRSDPADVDRCYADNDPKESVPRCLVYDLHCCEYQG